MRTPSVSANFGRECADPPGTGTLARSVMSSLNAGATASIVNRTHRVVRARAQAMQANRSKLRSLFLPLALCSSLMILLFSAVFVMMEQYEFLSPDEMPSESHHALILMWFLPVTFGLIATVWFRRSRSASDAGAIR